MTDIEIKPQSSQFTLVQVMFGIVAVLAFVITAGAVFMLPDLRSDSTMRTMFATTINNGFLLVLGFWYGSSIGSDRKTDLINKMAIQPQTVNIDKAVTADTVVADTTGEVDVNTAIKQGDTLDETSK